MRDGFGIVELDYNRGVKPALNKTLRFVAAVAVPSLPHCGRALIDRVEPRRISLLEQQVIREIIVPRPVNYRDNMWRA